MKEKLLKSLKDSIVLNPTERVWQMPFFGAFGVGIVLLAFQPFMKGLI